MKRYVPIMAVLLLFTLAGATLAHTPQTRTFLLSQGQEFLPGQKVAIEDPTESMALYGVLQAPGQAAVYGFEVNGPYHLRALLQVPVVPGDLYRNWRPQLVLVGPDAGAHRPATLETLLNGGIRFNPEFTSIFHEPFGHTDYHRGPALERDLTPGHYLLLVFSPRGAGAYTLVLGERETARSVVQAVAQRRELDSILAAGGKVALRSRLGLSAYHYLLLLGAAFGLLAWLLCGWAEKSRIGRWVLGLADLLSAAFTGMAVLFIWVSVLPGWVRLSASIFLVLQLMAVFRQGRGLRLVTWAAIGLLAVVCMV